MFGIDFFELIVIAIVALVVVGPERLPKVARTAGHLFGRGQRYVNAVKADLSREMHLEELKKLQGEAQESLNNIESGIAVEIEAVQQGAEMTVVSAESAIHNTSEELEQIAQVPGLTREEPIAHGHHGAAGSPV